MFTEAGVSATVRADLARGQGPLWEALKSTPAAMTDPAATRQLITKLAGG